MKTKVIITVMAIMLVFLLAIGISPKPQHMSLTEFREKRDSKATGRFIITGTVHSEGTSLGNVISQRIKTDDNRSMHYLRLQDEDGKRVVVWLDPKRTPLPEKNDHVEITGRFKKIKTHYKGKSLPDKNIGYVTKIKVTE